MLDNRALDWRSIQRCYDRLNVDSIASLSLVRLELQAFRLKPTCFSRGFPDGCLPFMVGNPVYLGVDSLRVHMHQLLHVL